MMLIYKIASTTEWEEATRTGASRGGDRLADRGHDVAHDESTSEIVAIPEIRPRRRGTDEDVRRL